MPCNNNMGVDRLFEHLNKLRGTKTLIVGIGNTLKGDDGAGPVVCQQLAGKISADLIDTGTVPENYIRKIINKAPENLVIIDAVDFGADPGAIKIFEPAQLSSTAISTHTLSPAVFVDMIQKEIEVCVYFIGIQPRQIQIGSSLSADVEGAVKLLSRTLAEVFKPKNTT